MQLPTAVPCVGYPVKRTGLLEAPGDMGKYVSKRRLSGSQVQN